MENSGAFVQRSPMIPGDAVRDLSAGAHEDGPVAILRWSLATRERVLASPLEAGRVHSVFRGALNLLWHDGRLLSLHGPTALAAPFAAALSRLPRGVTPGMDVRRCAGHILLGAESLVWEGAGRAATSIQPAGVDLDALAARLRDQAGPPVPPGLCSEGSHTAQQLIAHGIRSGEPAAFLEGARALIGLGEGLTPAGDDCLVGVLAVLQRFRRPWLESHPEITTAMAAAVEDGTTMLGREFILHALDGSFSEVMLRVVTAPSADGVLRAAAQLLATGGTSGADTLRGMRLALEALRR